MSKCILYPNNTKEWINDKGELHREDGPAREGFGAHKEWWLNNKHHRVDGPALEFTDGTKMWYLNGKRHREDGPAREYISGTKEWYYHGKLIECNSQEEFLKIINMRAFW